jgi:23S rRNA pseudouridine1911/1915/1917 synthase
LNSIDYSEAEDRPDEATVIQVSARGAAGERLDRFLTARLSESIDGLSRSRVQKWIALGAVSCGDRAISPSTRLDGFEILSVTPMPREADSAFEADPVSLTFVDEDSQILVIDKPAGMVVHPAPGNWRNTLLNGLLHHRPAQRDLPRAGIVHRLDKETSGLMVVARSERALASLVGQLADRSMSRRYLAVAAGHVPAVVEIDEPIGRDPRSRLRMAVVHGPSGKPARTTVTRLCEMRLGNQAATLVECRLHSGRTHQIRVHLKHLGYPLIGDAVYGGPCESFSRQALHAWRLGLQDPLDGRPRHWISRPPPDLQALIAASGADLTQIMHDLEQNACNSMGSREA